MNGEPLNEQQQEQLLMMMLIQQHQQIAMMGMGMLKNPATDKIERDLNQAKFAIDTLNALANFTKGNLPEELSRYLNETLTNLRLNYVDEKNKQPADSNGETKEESDS